MLYKPTDPLTDPARQPDELRRLNLEQDSSGGAMRPWIVVAIAVIFVATLVYGYTRPIFDDGRRASLLTDDHRRRAGGASDGQPLGGDAVSSAFNIGAGQALIAF